MMNCAMNGFVEASDIAQLITLMAAKCSVDVNMNRNLRYQEQNSLDMNDDV